MRFTLALAALVVLVGLCEAAAVSKRSLFGKMSPHARAAPPPYRGKLDEMSPHARAAPPHYRGKLDEMSPHARAAPPPYRGKLDESVKRNLLSALKRQGGGGSNGGGGNGGAGNGGAGPSGGADGPPDDHSHNRCFDDEKAWLALTGYSAMEGKCDAYGYELLEKNGIDELTDETYEHAERIWAADAEDPLAPIMHSVCEHVWKEMDAYHMEEDEAVKEQMRQKMAHFGYLIACSNGLADIELGLIYDEGNVELQGHLLEILVECQPAFEEGEAAAGYEWLEEQEPAKRKLTSLHEQLKQVINKKKV